MPILFNSNLDITKGEHPEGLKSPLTPSPSNSPSSFSVQTPTRSNLGAFLEDYRQQEEKFKEQQQINSLIHKRAMQSFLDNINIGSGGNKQNAITNIKDLVAQVSPHYRKYKDEYDLDELIGDNGWINLAANYEATRAAQGEKMAIAQLRNSMQDLVSEKQTLYEKSVGATQEFLGSFAGSLIGVAGIFKGLYDVSLGDRPYNENMGVWNNVVDAAIDNNWSRYGNDIIQWGAFDPKKIEEAKKEGIADTGVIETSGQEQGTDEFWDQIFNRNTIFKAFGQSGFTAGMAVQAIATEGLSNALFSGMKYGTMAARSAGIIKTLDQTKNALATIQRSQKLFNTFAIPAFSGTGEGAIEGLQTKLTVYEQGLEHIQEQHEKAIVQDVFKDLETMKARQTTVLDENGESQVAFVTPDGKIIDTMALYNKHAAEREEQLQGSLNHLETVAAKAGVGNFMVNSAINGIINSTFKAALLAPRTQQALANNKLFSWARPSSKFNVDIVGNKYSVTPYLSSLRKGFNYIKEPLGEFTEEYLQTLSDETMRGMADFNLHTYVEKKYAGNAQVAVGEEFSGQWGAAWNALTKAIGSQEAFKAGIYGAIGSLLGNPAMRTHYKGRARDDKGKVIKGAKGALKTAWQNSPIYWRFGARTNYLEARESNDAISTQASALEEWLNDPNNRAKFDGAAGTYAWAAEMQARASNNDIFGFRASKLGKTVNDIFMLNKLKGTTVYDQIMQNLQQAANMEEDSEFAQQLIQSVQQNKSISSLHEGKDSGTLFKEIKENATDMLSMMDKMQQAEKEFSRLYSDQNGELDQDLKESLVFGRLLVEDYEKRIPELGEVIDKVTAKIGEVSSEGQITKLDKDDDKLLSVFGSFEEAFRQKKTITTTIENLKEQLQKEVEKNGAKSKGAKQIAHSINSYSNLLDLINKTEQKYNEGTPTISAAAILNASPKTRAKILSLGKKKFYTESKKSQDEGEESSTETTTNVPYFSSEQQDIIDSLMAEGVAQDAGFLDKVIDYSRMVEARERALKQEIAILSDKDSFNKYVSASKQQAKLTLAKAQAEELNKIEDFQEFSDRYQAIVGKLEEEFDSTSIVAINKFLKSQNNEHYNKFQEERKNLADVFEYIQRDKYFADHYNDNDINILLHTLSYLINKGHSVLDTEEAEAVLQELNPETGNTRFQEYIDEQNSKVEEEQEKLLSYSPEIIVSRYLDLIDRFNKHRDEVERRTAPIEVTTETSEEPPQRELPPAFEGQRDEEQQLPKEVDLKDLPVSSKSLLDRLHKENNPRIVAALGEAIMFIKNDFVEQHKELMDSLDIEGEDIINAIEGILSNIVNYKYNSDSELASRIRMITPSITDTNLRDLVSVALQEMAKNIVNSIGKRDAVYSRPQSGNRRLFGNTKSGRMSTINMENVVKAHPESPIAQFIVKHGIKEFIRDKYYDYAVSKREEGGPELFFYVDSALTEQVQESMGENYTAGDIPVIVLVEHEEGTMTIGDKKYQPVGIMPATPKNTTDSGVLGSANMEGIRNLIKNQDGFITDSSGNRLVTRPIDAFGGIVAYHPDQSYNGESISIASLVADMYSEAERAAIEQNPASKWNIYKKVRNFIIDRLFVSSGTNRNKLVVFRPSDLKTDSASPIQVSVRSIEDTINESGQSFIDILKAFTSDDTAELFRTNSADNIVNFNNITKEIEKLLTSTTSTKKDSLYGLLQDFKNSIEEGADQNTLIDKKKNLENYGDSLTRAIRNLIYFDQSYKIKIEENSGAITIAIVDKETNKLEKILVQIQNISEFEETSNLVTAQIIANIVLKDGQVHKNAVGNFANWQFDYQDVLKLRSDNEQDRDPAKRRIADLIDSHILEIKGTSLGYHVLGIQMHNPLVQKNGETTPRFIEGDTHNARFISSGETHRGVTVEPDTGTNLSGTSPEPLQSGISANVQGTIDRILEDSSKYTLDQNGDFYVEEGTGQLIYRVSTIKDSSYESDSTFDPNSPFAVPSHAVGNVIDQFIRDFFSDNIQKYNLKNARSRKQLINKVSKKLGLRNADLIQDIYIDAQTGNVVIKFGDPALKNIQGTLTFRPQDLDNAQIVYNALDESNITEEEASIIGRTPDSDQTAIIINGLLEENSVLRTLDTTKSEKNAKTYGLATFNGEEFAENSESNLLALAEEQGIDTEFDYPIISKQDLHKLQEDLQKVKSQWEAQGWTIVANDVKAIGTVDVYTSSEGVVQKRVAGTLDILLINGDNQFKVVDIKTIHKSSKRDFDAQVEYRRTAWRLQTSMYAKFLQDTYGLTLIGQEILPIEVSYPTPTQQNPYTVTASQELKQGDNEVTVGASLKNAIKLEYLDPGVIDEIKLKKVLRQSLIAHMSEKEKEEIKTAIEELKSSIDASGTEITVGEGTSMEDDLFGDDVDWGDDFTGSTQMVDTPNTIIPIENIWENLPESTKETLEKFGITQTTWDKELSESEYQHFKECLGL